MYIVLTREISFAQCLRQLHRQGQIFVCMKFCVCVCVDFFCVFSSKHTHANTSNFRALFDIFKSAQRYSNICLKMLSAL